MGYFPKAVSAPAEMHGMTRRPRICSTHAGGVCVYVCVRACFSAYVLWKCTVNVCRLYAFLQVCICTVLHYTFKCTCLKSVYTFECACMHVCVLRITQCRLVGETVRIQADYRGEIQSLHHTDPVFYLWKTGGYMS